MRKLTFIIILLSAALNSAAQGFNVQSFTADIYLDSAGYFDVVENYDIEFTESKHGIYRDLVTDYTLQTLNGNKEKRKLVIKNIEVPGHPYHINPRFEQRISGQIDIRIGDKNKTVIGLEHYQIKYRVYNGLLFENGLVQLYWNIKPDHWNAIFRQINFRIHCPPSAIISPENCFVYFGVSGIRSNSTDFTYGYKGGIFSANSKQGFYAVQGQNVTCLVKLPQELIKETHLYTPFWQAFGWIIVLVLLLLAFWLVWLKYGKEAKIVSVTSYYPPENIDPAMAGYLINDKEDASDLIACFPDWARQGYISIEEIPKDGLFGTSDIKINRLNPLPVSAPEYQQIIFNSLFNIWGNHVLISTLRNNFYIPMNQAKNCLERQAQSYYEPSGKKAMKITMVAAIIAAVLLCALFLFAVGPIAAIISTLVCVFIALMSFYLQKKNSKGNALFGELKGFRHFIKMAELSRIKSLIIQDPDYFETTMSYALAFGLLDKWAKKFDALDVDIKAPAWYHSHNSGASMARMSLFSKSFTHSMASMQSTLVSSPSSSSSGGGGSSGGGFGGGGGGSW